MKVNIVLVDDNHILPRMAGWLAERNGWNISDEPDNNADINYYMPYLMFDYAKRPDTLTSGWFTHYELGTQWKMEAWRNASTFIDMPCITSPVYASIEYGLSHYAIVTPGVDRERFVPIKEAVNDKPVIGTAGVGQPRKGVGMIAELFYAGIGAEFRVAGINWPFGHVSIGTEYMPQWFAYLDVYLCASTIEGIPAPVLEALSCDTKVVVPYGVGICDLLPEMAGIRHYKANDTDDCKRAILQALDDKPSEGALRAVTEDYTIDHWCDSHQVAMEKLVNAAIPV